MAHLRKAHGWRLSCFGHPARAQARADHAPGGGASLNLSVLWRNALRPPVEAGQCFGEGWLAGQSHRMAPAFAEVLAEMVGTTRVIDTLLDDLVCAFHDVALSARHTCGLAAGQGRTRSARP